MKIEAIIEALLFAAPKAMSAEELIKALEQTRNRVGTDLDFIIPSLNEIQLIIKKLQETYDHEGRAFQIYQVNHGYKLGTRAAYAPWVETLYEEKPTKLSAAALETLAVIAYRQPISRFEIEAIRGVAVDGVIQSLIERRLIKNAGRSMLPGRPVLYQTTDLFLEQFGLSSLDELPDVHELRRVDLGVHRSDLFRGRDGVAVDFVDERASEEGGQTHMNLAPAIEIKEGSGLNEETKNGH